jgi:hypothetical protein
MVWVGMMIFRSGIETAFILWNFMLLELVYIYRERGTYMLECPFYVFVEVLKHLLLFNQVNRSCRLTGELESEPWSSFDSWQATLFLDWGLIHKSWGWQQPGIMDKSLLVHPWGLWIKMAVSPQTPSSLSPSPFLNTFGPLVLEPTRSRCRLRSAPPSVAITIPTRSVDN